MSSDEAREIVSDGQEGVADQGVVGFTRGVLIGGPVMAGAITIVEILVGIPQTFLAPVQAFASGLSSFISGTLLAPTTITEAGAAASAASFVSGTGALLGPLAFPVAVAVSAIGVFVFLMFLRRISISPLQLIQERRGR